MTRDSQGKLPLIKLEQLNRAEALRYLGMGGQTPDERTLRLLEESELLLLDAARPSYITRCLPISPRGDGIGFEGCELCLRGGDIKKHLEHCEKAVLLCATIGAGIDRLIRRMQVEDMAKAIVLDSLASVAIEQVCDKLEGQISADFPSFHKTWRFSPGYGDLPIGVQGDLLSVLDAPRKAGVCLSSGGMLTPVKSVTAVIGLSQNKIERKKRSCGDCSLRDTCAFRKAGTRCV